MPTCDITTEGHSILHRLAERAVLKVKVSSSRSADRAVLKAKVSPRPPRDIAAHDVTATARHLQKLIAPLNPQNEHGHALDHAAITHFSMSSIKTSSHVPQDANKNPLPEVYRASTSFEIKFKDFSKLGALAKELSTMEFVELDGVDWKLTDATKESLASHNRREAMRDAVRKARDFADALDMPRFVPVEVKEGQVYERTGSHGMPPPKKQNVVFSEGEADEDALQFVPEEVKLHAKVNAKFVVEESKTVEAVEA